MKHEEIKIMIPLLTEGGLSEEQKLLIEKHLQECDECKKEFQDFMELEEALGSMKFKEPDEAVWEKFSDSIYNRLERKTGWIIAIFGLLILLVIGAWNFLERLLGDPETSIFMVIGLFTFVAGSIILFISILKEQLFYRKKERYKEIDR